MVFDRNCESQRSALEMEWQGTGWSVGIPDGEIRDSNNKHKRLKIAQQFSSLEDLAIAAMLEDGSLICPPGREYRTGCLNQ